MWPFRKKPEPPADFRNWNEDWRIGDIAECAISFEEWNDCVKPWHRPKKGEQFKVLDIYEAVNAEINARAYFLLLDGWPVSLTTNSFRKPRAVATEQSEIVKRILDAPAGPDKVRETDPTHNRG